jgi:hypothetical protein
MNADGKQVLWVIGVHLRLSAALYDFSLPRKRKSPAEDRAWFKPGNFLLSHTLAHAVPSGLRGLTSVFGMGTGGSPSLRSPRNRDRHSAISFQLLTLDLIADC